MKEEKFLVGSRAFFTGLDGFKPKDTDNAYLVNGYTSYKYVQQIQLRESCHFFWKKYPKQEMIEYALEHGKDKNAMLIGKFLVPEFAKALDFTIQDLKQLEPLIENLDDKHKYEEIIFNAYMENGDFILTDEQRQKAFEEYLKYRQK